MKIRIGNEVLKEHLRAKVRFDFQGVAKAGRFFFGGKSNVEVAEQRREEQLALFKNVPLQGIWIEDLDSSTDIYFVREGEGRRSTEVAYAPVLLTLRLENFDDLLPLILRPEFRTIEFLSPESISLHRLDAERLFFRLSQAYLAEFKKLEQRLM